jgi:hypothetical protein
MTNFQDCHLVKKDLGRIVNGEERAAAERGPDRSRYGDRSEPS